MGENKIVAELLGKVPQLKETVEKVESATGKSIENMAGEIGEKIVDAIKEQGQDDPRDVLNNMKNKIFGKND